MMVASTSMIESDTALTDKALTDNGQYAWTISQKFPAMR